MIIEPLSWPLVLIIDDNPADAELISYYIRRSRSVRTMHVRTIREAFEVAKTHRFAKVICDMTGINGDGYQFIKDARATYNLKDAEIVGISGNHVTEEDIAKAINAGFDDFFKKPNDMTELGEKLSRIRKRPAVP